MNRITRSASSAALASSSSPVFGVQVNNRTVSSSSSRAQSEPLPAMRFSTTVIRLPARTGLCKPIASP